MVGQPAGLGPWEPRMRSRARPNVRKLRERLPMCRWEGRGLVMCDRRPSERAATSIPAGGSAGVGSGCSPDTEPRSPQPLRLAASSASSAWSKTSLRITLSVTAAKYSDSVSLICSGYTSSMKDLGTLSASVRRLLRGYRRTRSP
jgi:hypothetical protein